MRIKEHEMTRSVARETGTPFRRPTNVSLDAALIDKAKELGINVSRACEDGLAKEVKEELGRRWLKDNQAAIESSNAYVEKHGLPLAKYRPF
jgi:antitoxin CcdA